MGEEFSGHIDNYQDLLEAVVSELARGDVSLEASRWIAATELEIYRDCNPRPGDQKISGTMAASDSTIPMPDGAISLVHLQLDLSPLRVLKIATLDKIMALRENDKSGIPSKYFLYGNELEVGPANGGDGTTPYTMWYYGLPPKISMNVPTNEIFQLGWDAYLYGALMHSAPYLGDDARLVTWASLYSSKKDSLQSAYWRSRMSGHLEQQPDTYLSDSHSGTR